MLIGIPRESRAGETRVAATPKTVDQLLKLGYAVTVESGAGAEASFDDASFAAAGATVGTRDDVWAADIVAKINAPDDAEIARLRPGATVVSLMQPALNPGLVDALAARGVTAMAMDAVPRISRAQALDVLSSMANIAGYRAVVEAAHEFGSFFTGQVTAAGKVPPAKVFVSGAGVAGLAAIGTARSLGAIVRATDVRPEVAEQVESMGADFVKVDVGEQEVSSDGYAKEVGADYAAAAARMYAEQCQDVDIIITTALIPGRPAPRLITAEMVATMKAGSVIVDMAASAGGNVEGSAPDRLVVTDNGVTIIGYTDLPSRLPGLASQLYATNVVNLLKLATPEANGSIVVDFDDEVLRNMTVTRGGEITFPPPPIQVSAAPAVKPEAHLAPQEAQEPKAPKPWYLSFGIVGVLAIGLIALLTYAPASFVSLFGVFALALVVGYYVVWNVTAALHTPLMSVTNAVSGIILVGAITQLGNDNWAIKIIATGAVLIASINVFGGFTVTQRMLKMFRKG